MPFNWPIYIISPRFRFQFYLSAQFLGCPLIENGDKLGIYTDADPSPVAYQFSGVNPTSLMNVNENVSNPYQIGSVVAFDMLPFPYMLSAAPVRSHLAAMLPQRGIGMRRGEGWGTPCHRARLWEARTAVVAPAVR